MSEVTETTCPLRSVLRFVARWGGGAVFAMLAIWGIGALFVSDVTPMVYCESLDRWVYQPHSPRFCAAEGWGVSRFGPAGIEGLPAGVRSLPADLDKIDRPLLLFAGDSFVEAFQVDTDEKMFSQFNDLWSRRTTGPEVLAVGVGQSDRNLSDAYFLLPRYERLLVGKVAGHVLILHTVDLLPNGKNMHLDGERLFTETQHIPKMPALGPVLKDHKLSIFYWATMDMLESLHSLRLRPGPVSPPTKEPPIPSASQYETFWRASAKALTSALDRPVLVVLVPHTPRLVDGQWLTVDPHHDVIEGAVRAFRAEGVHAVSLEQYLANRARREGRLPSGFANSYPGRGHWNAAGHRWVAEGVYEYLRAHPEWFSECATGAMVSPKGDHGTAPQSQDTVLPMNRD